MDFVKVLPKEIVNLIFAFSQTKENLLNTSLVCKEWYQAATNKELYQKLSIAKWTERYCNLEAYNGNWRQLYCSENCYNIVHAVRLNSSCMWRMNSNDRHYECIILKVTWNRLKKRLCFHFDVRGESDLRDPWVSLIYRRPWSTTPHEPNNRSWYVDAPDYPSIAPIETKIFGSRTGHIKGCLYYPEDFFTIAGATYTFNYDGGTDYHHVDLFAIPPASSLSHFFYKEEKNVKWFEEDDVEEVVDIDVVWNHRKSYIVDNNWGKEFSKKK